jgi:hypothetical protein
LIQAPENPNRTATAHLVIDSKAKPAEQATGQDTILALLGLDTRADLRKPIGTAAPAPPG